jgi:DNA-binding transcriptional LysR family regulator
MVPETNDITVFLAVVQHGSFSRAASSLLVSQPAVSERMVRLERSLGTKLFERGARGTTLTPAGSRFLPYASRTVDLLVEASRAVEAGDHALPVRIGVHTTFAHRAVPLVLTAVGEPPPKITVRDAHSDEIIAMLLDGVIDVGFVLPGARPPRLRFVRLDPDPVVPVCSPEHDLAPARNVALPRLRGHRIALNRWGAGAEQFIDQLKAAGVTEDQVLECSDGVTTMRLARHHGYVALVTRSLVRDAIDDNELTRLLLRPAPRWTVPVALAYRASDHQVPVIATLRREVRAARMISRRSVRQRP